MRNSQTQELADLTREEIQAALFAQMVMQQSSMALMLMGKSPRPDTGQTVRDIEGARMFIDQLEMLEAKTRGNLSKEEELILKQTLMGLRMAFVEAVEKPVSSEGTSKIEEKKEVQAAESAEKKPETAEIPEPEESKRRFSKKFSL
jgi:hypothetical protein